MFYRYSVKHLLDHEFFAENVKFELLDAEKNEAGSENTILTMRMELPTKETPKSNKGQESIEFIYDLHKDDPAEVVKEMVRSTQSYSLTLPLTLMVFLHTTGENWCSSQ